MSNEIDALHGAYRRARIEFLDAEQGVRSVQKAVQRVANSLRGSVPGYDSETLVSPSYTPGISKWVEELPEKIEISGLLDEWYRARKALKEAFNALPIEEQRQALELPRGAKER